MIKTRRQSDKNSNVNLYGPYFKVDKNEITFVCMTPNEMCAIYSLLMVYLHQPKNKTITGEKCLCEN